MTGGPQKYKDIFVIKQFSGDLLYSLVFLYSPSLLDKNGTQIVISPAFAGSTEL